jgi:hypothetical protein
LLLAGLAALLAVARALGDAAAAPRVVVRSFIVISSVYAAPFEREPLEAFEVRPFEGAPLEEAAPRVVGGASLRERV